MSFKGQFYWIQSIRQGGRKAISFTLTCTNIFQSETFDATIVAGTGQVQPMMFRQQTIKAKESFRFDFDTVDWDWCQGDIFAILDKKGQMAQKWVLNLKTYAPGECPECHGTHKCRQCNGTGIITNRRSHTINSCTVCNGTGICQTCFIPMRNTSIISGGNPIYTPTGNTYHGGGQGTNADAARQRKIAALKSRISELRAKLDDAKYEERVMKLRGTDVTSHTVYTTHASLVYRYEKSLIELQHQLSQLEQMEY